MAWKEIRFAVRYSQYSDIWAKFIAVQKVYPRRKPVYLITNIRLICFYHTSTVQHKLCIRDKACLRMQVMHKFLNLIAGEPLTRQKKVLFVLLLLQQAYKFLGSCYVLSHWVVV